MKPEIDTLRYLLDYDVDTGLLFWKERPLSMFSDRRSCNTWNSRYVGKRAFSTPANNILVGRFRKKNYAAHQIIWALHYGEWKESRIWHLDQDGQNNSISNLTDQFPDYLEMPRPIIKPFKDQSFEITDKMFGFFFSYDSESGEIRRKDPGIEFFDMYGDRQEAMHGRWVKYLAGELSDRKIRSDGYRQISFFGQTFLAHRVAWLLYTGRWPNPHIDHHNGLRSDNRIVNLREVDDSENSKNRRMQGNNTSGAVGVSRKKGGWSAKIKINQRNIALGWYKNFEDAVKARKIAEKKYGFHENHGLKFNGVADGE